MLRHCCLLLRELVLCHTHDMTVVVSTANLSVRGLALGINLVRSSPVPSGICLLLFARQVMFACIATGCFDSWVMLAIRFLLLVTPLATMMEQHNWREVVQATTVTSLIKHGGHLHPGRRKRDQVSQHCRRTPAPTIIVTMAISVNFPSHSVTWSR